MADLDTKSTKSVEREETPIDEKHAADFAEEKGVVYADIQEAAEHLSLDEAKDIIREAIAGKQFDPNFDQSLLLRATSALKEESLSHEIAAALVEEIKLEAALMDDSPYIEVRASVDNTDDVDAFVNTFRSWSLGILFVILGTGLNTFFAARNPGIILTTQCVQVLSYPLAKAMEWGLPTRSVTLFGKQWSLNPGRFSIKEHMAISIMANVTFGGAVGVYSTDLIFVQRLPQFFNQNELASKAGYQILLTISTQLIGFSLAGLSRRFLVYPPAMIWPANLATIVLNRSFHQDTNPVAHGWRITRLRLFTYIFVGYGLYFVFPDAIFSALTYFNWMTWISPSNVKLAMITGSISGLGVSPWTTFDWSYATALCSPLVSPLFSTLNQYAGMILVGLTMIPAIYFTNTWNTAYLPINSNHLYDNTGGRYNVSRVLNSDFTLNVAAYEAYSEVWQSAGNAVVFGAFFAVYTATMVHVALYYRTEVINGVRAVFQRKNPRLAYNDVHNRLMRKYKEVPEWWYMTILCVALAFGIAANEVYQTQMPVWAIFFCVGLGAIFLVPIGIITAITNVELTPPTITLNVVAELIGSYALPGRPVAVMIFKTYGFIGIAQAVGYSGDLKIGHYVKIPPRSLFAFQLVASLIACFVGIAVADFQINNIPGICGNAQAGSFTCPGYTTFFNSGVQWGAIGAERLYAQGRIYNPLMYGFLVGAIIPFPIYFLTRRYPNSFWKYVSAPVLLYGPLNWAPYNLSYMTPAIPLALFFQGYLRQRKTAWWSKYNYIVSSALTSAVSIFGIIWFFALLYNSATAPSWWGNNIPFEGCDATGCPLLDIPDIGYFGPAPILSA